MTDTPQMIFVNLPVRDLNRSKAFFTALGFTPNLTYTDDKAASFNISDTIMLMLLLEPSLPPLSIGRSAMRASRRR